MIALIERASGTGGTSGGWCCLPRRLPGGCRDGYGALSHVFFFRFNIDARVSIRGESMACNISKSPIDKACSNHHVGVQIRRPEGSPRRGRRYRTCPQSPMNRGNPDGGRFKISELLYTEITGGRSFRHRRRVVMNRKSLTPIRQTEPSAAWRGKDPPATNTGDHYGTVQPGNVETPHRPRSGEERIVAMRPRDQETDPVNSTVRACFGTSAVYSCTEKQCSLRDRCTRSVSPWRF